MPDVTPICWDPKDCRLRFMRLLFERSGISDGRLTASLPVISLLLLCLGRVILGLGKVLPERDRPCGALAWLLAAYRAGDFVERHCHLRGDAMGAPLGVVFYHWGGLQALA